MTLDQHLAHLLLLTQEYPQAWRNHVWHRANELAQRPELADLPRLLTEALKSSSTAASGTHADRSSTDAS